MKNLLNNFENLSEPKKSILAGVLIVALCLLVMYIESL